MSSPQKKPFPTVDQVRQLPPQLSMKIPPEWEDRNGHVNVQYYVTLYELGGWNVLEAKGFDEDWFRRNEVSVFDLEHHLNYLAELRIGDRVSTYHRVLGHSEKRFHGMYFVVNDDREQLACCLEYVASNVDMRLRRTAPFLPELAQCMDELLLEHELLDWPTPVCGAMKA